MDMMKLIKTRKSVRTFNGKSISTEDREKLCSYIKTIQNPYNIPVKFVLLDSAKYGLSSPVIHGEQLYIAGKIPKTVHSEEAFGYSFEMMVLYAWSIGIGTTWIGGTMNRELFERAAETREDEQMMIVSSLGYPADFPSDVDRKLRATVHGDERLPSSNLFYEKDFSTPLTKPEEILEAVRWAPSAVNRQPARVVKDGNLYHLYLKHTEGYSSTEQYGWDVQKIDMGIALYHLMSVTDGKCIFTNPGIKTEKNTEYIATVMV